MNTKIIEVNWGIANYYLDRAGDFIEINKNLSKYPGLLKEIIDHELEHGRSKNKYMDVGVEIRDLKNFGLTKKMFWFMLFYPRALTQLLPFSISHKGRVHIDFFVVFMYIMLGIIITLMGVRT